MRNAMLTLVLTAGLTVAADPPRLTYEKRVQTAGQSDYEFAKKCVPVPVNEKTLGDREWEREQDRLDAAYQKGLYKVFDWVAEQRADPLAAFDLKIAFQEEKRDKEEEYVANMEAKADALRASDSMLDRTLAEEYKAQASKAKLRLADAKAKLKALESDRRKAEKKR